MAKKAVDTEVKYRLIVSESELELLRTGLDLIRNFGRVEDWDQAMDLIADLSEEN